MTAKDPSVIGIFLLFLIPTLLITLWSSRLNKTRDQFFAAGNSISGVQNGFAFAGDFLSAAAFLGVAGLYFIAGLDGLVYGLGALIGWPVLLFLLSERLRKLGQYTLTDVLTVRLEPRPIKIFSATANLIVLLFYLLSQMVGAGVLVNMLLGLDFSIAVAVVGILMIIYVIFGGMVATTWVQLTKAIILVCTTTLLAFLTLRAFSFDFGRLVDVAIERHPSGDKIMSPGGLITTPGASASLALTLIFGPAGLPHVLMRFFTVPNTAEARKSAFVATVVIGFFCLLMLVIGFGSIALLSENFEYVDQNGSLKGGSNLAALHLAGFLGGNILLGVVSAVAFATILAVVSGLTLAAAATLSRDVFPLFNSAPLTESQELRISRISAIAFGITGMVLSIAFKNENITFLSATAMSIAASATFPILLLSLFWSRLTTRGAVWGGSAGLVVALLAIILGPSVWVSVIGNETPIFPYQYPTIVSMPLAFAVAVGISLRSR